MNRILVIGVTAVGAIGLVAAPADAAHKSARANPSILVHHDGYAVAPTQSFASGAAVEEVIPNTGAARAGIRPGDIVVGVNGKPINGYAELDSNVAASSGRPVTIDINRTGHRLRVRVSPTLAITQNWYGAVEQRRVLGIAHTESRLVLMPCALDPTCE